MEYFITGFLIGFFAVGIMGLLRGNKKSKKTKMQCFTMGCNKPVVWKALTNYGIVVYYCDKCKKIKEKQQRFFCKKFKKINEAEEQ